MMDGLRRKYRHEQDAAHRDEAAHLISASVIVGATTLAAKFTGILREAASAAVFGANRAMDAFVVAKSIPDMVSTWIEMPARSAFIPLFTRSLRENGEEVAWRAASNLLNCILVLVVLVSIVLAVGAGWAVRALSTGFRDEQAWTEGTRLAQLMALSVAFSVAAVLLGSLSNIYRRQIVPGLARLASGVVVLASVAALGPRLGLAGYAWGVLGGAVVAFLIQTDVVWRHHHLYRPILRPRAPEIREFASLAWPLFIGLSGTRLDVVIDRNFASFLPAGHLSLLIYATFLSATLTELLMNISQSVLLPHFAHLAASGKQEELRLRLTQALDNYLLFLAPLTALVCGAARPIVEIVFGRGRFSTEDIALTALIVPILAVADPAFGAGQVLAQAHISVGNTRTPMKIGFIRLGLKTIVSLALVPAIGIFGLATSSALSTLLRSFLLWKALPSAIRPLPRAMWRMTGGFLASVGVGGTLVWGAAQFVTTPNGGQAMNSCAVLAGGVLAVGSHFLLGRLSGSTHPRQLGKRLRSAFLHRYAEQAPKEQDLE